MSRQAGKELKPLDTNKQNCLLLTSHLSQQIHPMLTEQDQAKYHSKNHKPGSDGCSIIFPRRSTRETHLLGFSLVTPVHTLFPYIVSSFLTEAISDISVSLRDLDEIAIHYNKMLIIYF